MTRLLALDLGTACGWALADHARFKDDNDAVMFGTFDLRAGRFSGGGMRFVRFENELNKFSDIDQVVFEEVRRHRGTDAAHVYGGLLAVLTAWCEKNKIPYEGVTVQAIKKFATGKGNADKAQMISAVEGWGFQPKNDNEADAIALLRLRLSETKALEPTVPLPRDCRKLVGPALRAPVVRPAARRQDCTDDPRFR
jgi:crossover junction endodeoxyribonuclease RuvC